MGVPNGDYARVPKWALLFELRIIHVPYMTGASLEKVAVAH